MAKTSVIIPSRNEIFLQKTVDDILQKAKDEIEIIVVLDGYWPDPPLKENSKVIIIHRPEARGMRDAINSAARISTGKYLLKSDAHCMFGEGFDSILQNDMADDWVVIPRRYSLEPEEWKIKETGKSPIDYHYLSYPYEKPNEVGMHGVRWDKRAREKKDILIDDEMSSQGSCWFMNKLYFDKHLGGLSEYGYGNFVQEMQEIGLKTWLGGGRLVINKKTWYAHLHKGKTYGRGYYISQPKMIQGAVYSADYWMNNRWKERKYDLAWLIDKFWPVPSWPTDWLEKNKSTKIYYQIPKDGTKEIAAINTQELPKPRGGDIVDEKSKTINLIKTKFNLDFKKMRVPIEIPNVGRDDMAKMFGEFGFTKGAEIGVEQGVFSEVLCKSIPNLKLWSIDSWKAYRGYRDHVSQEKLDGFYEITKERLKLYNVELVRKFSMDAVKDFKDGSLDFVYIDGNHSFIHVAQDLDAWSKKVRVGGIIAGHDFVKFKGSILHVVQVVWAFTESYEIRPWFILGSKDKKEGQVRDHSRSYMWVNGNYIPRRKK